MPSDFDWMVLINKRAALREQFPPLQKLRGERPGSAQDMERKRRYREATELSRMREQQARWNAAVAENTRRKERADNNRRAIEYKARQRARHELGEGAA